MDRVALVLTREDRLDQGRELLWGEGAADQTSAGWSVVVEKVGEIGILYKIGEGGNGGVPLSDVGVAEGSAAFRFRVSIPPPRRGILAFRVRVAGLVWGALGMQVEFKGRKQFCGGLHTAFTKRAQSANVSE